MRVKQNLSLYRLFRNARKFSRCSLSLTSPIELCNHVICACGAFCANENGPRSNVGPDLGGQQLRPPRLPGEIPKPKSTPVSIHETLTTPNTRNQATQFTRLHAQICDYHHTVITREKILTPTVWRFFRIFKQL